MTISTTTSRVDYAGNGVTTAFSVPFAFFGASELTVIERSSLGVETVRALTTDYTVSGGNGSTGTVTAVVAPASGVQWTILRSTARTQLTDYVSNDAFPAETHERALDRLQAQIQEVERDAGRALLVPATDSGGSLVLPTSTARASRFLAFDAGGLPIAAAGGVTGVVVSSFMETLLDDTSATAAQTTLGVPPIADAPPRAWTDLASAATTDLGATNAANLRITGTTTITAFGTAPSGTRRQLRFAGALTLTHDATSLILPGGRNIATADGDTAVAVSLGGGNWIVANYNRRAGGDGYLLLQRQVASAVAAVDFSLPAGYSRFRVDIDRASVSINGFGIGLQCGVGAVFDGGAADYNYSFFGHIGATVTAGNLSNSVLDCTGALLSTTSALLIEVHFELGSGSTQFIYRSIGSAVENTTPVIRNLMFCGSRVALGAKNAVRFLATGGANMSGTFTLFGVPA